MPQDRMVLGHILRVKNDIGGSSEILTNYLTDYLTGYLVLFQASED